MLTREEQSLLNKRLGWAGICFLVLIVGLGLRLMYLQVWEKSTLEMKNLDQVETSRKLQSPRGTIYDRNGHPLAMSVLTKSLYGDPTMLQKSPEEVAELLAPYVTIPKEEISKRLREDTAFVWIDRMMDLEKSKAVEAIIESNKLEGLNFVEESRRFYPNGNLLAQVLGFVGTDDKGLDGLEKELDDEIRGEETREIVSTDQKGNPIFGSVLKKYMPDKEKSVTLTIDSTIQFIAERALDKAMVDTKATGASIIIMDPKTGEILAMASRPTYDPNHFEKATEKEFKNTAVINLYEPGSTFKPIIAASALDAGTWTLDTEYNDVGSVTVNGHVIKNWNGEGYGRVKLLDILKYSINTGMVKIGLSTGGATLNKYVKAFGFGKKTGIDLPGEGDGILLKDDDMANIDTATMSIGQAVAVTPLQMVKAFGAIANGGKLMRPRIIKSVNNADGTVARKPDNVEEGQPIREDINREIVNILEKEISEGGGNKAYVEGYHFGGKTGTAEKIDPSNGGYLKGRYIASFVGFGPIEDSRFVALIVIDDPSGTFYGGQIAAPVFKDIMSQLVRYYQISPTSSKPHIGKGDESMRPSMPSIEKDEKGQVKIPNFTGWTTGEVRNWLDSAGLGFKPDGTGYAISQDAPIGSFVPAGSFVTVYFKR